MEGLDHLGEQLDDAGGRVELAAALALAHGEFPEEILVDAAEGVEVERGRDLGDFLEQILEQGAGEEVEGLGQDAGQLRIVFLDLAHGRVDLRSDVGRLGQGQQVLEPRLGGEVKDVFGVVGGRFIDAAAPAGRCAVPIQLGAPGRKTHLGEAQENQAEDGAGVFLGLQAGVGAELVGGIPEAFFQGGGGGFFFGGGDPVQVF